MHELKPLRVPLPVVVACAVMVLACGSSPDYSDDNYYYSDNTSSNNSSSSSSSSSSTYSPSTPSAPSQPVVPSNAPELNSSSVPDIPKSVDVTVLYGAPTKPSESAQEYWDQLVTKYNCKADSNRGDGTNPYFQSNYEFGTKDEKESLLLVAERRTDSSSSYAHGLAFLTYDSNRQYETYSAGQEWSTSDKYTLAVGYFRNGKMYGPVAVNFKEAARNGEKNKVHYLGEYDGGKANGEFRWWDEYGGLTEQMWAVGGERHGTSYRWNSTGSSQTEFVGGVAYGLRKAWDSSGRLIARGNYYDGRYYGKTEFWYPGSDIAYATYFYDFADSGFWKACYKSNGKLSYQAWVQGGYESGRFVEYTETGAKRWEGTREVGKNNGVFQRYTEDGWRDFDTVYVNGVQTGAVHWYYQGGGIKEEGQFQYGQRDGKFKSYDAEGNLAAEYNYSGGNLNGDYITYDTAGNVVTHDIYENGSFVRSALSPPWPAPTVVKDELGNDINRKWGRWRVETQDDMPPMEYGMSMAWSAELGGCVMFGGRIGFNEESKVTNQTWLRKDGAWQRIFADEDAPPSRDYACMAYDSDRGVVVLFGGRDRDGAIMGDTWELSATGWRIRSSATQPGNRAAAGLAYDTERKVCVLVCGLGPSATGSNELKSETWEWNGEDWAKNATTTTGPSVYGAAVAFDEERNRLVVSGGADTVAGKTQSWTFDGKRWTSATLGTYTANSMHGMVYDPDSRRVVLINNQSTSDNKADLRASVPAGDSYPWWQSLRGSDHPQGRSEFACAYDRLTRELVVFGGGFNDAGTPKLFRETLVLTDETPEDIEADAQSFLDKELSAPGWTHVESGEFSQDETKQWALTRDPERGVMVMFGGINGSALNNTTREFKDGAWTVISTEDAPSARYGALSWYDADRGKVMLFGGTIMEGGASKQLDDLWEWDGTNWSRLREHVAGTPESIVTWTYDEKRGVLVAISETLEAVGMYEFNGTSWKNTEAGEPSENYTGGMLAWDPIKEQVIYYYPFDEDWFDSLPLAWHWDGKYWAEYKPGLTGPDDSHGYRIYSDSEHKVLWQVTASAIRRFDGNEWKAWKRPTGLDTYNGRLWVDESTGKLYFHGATREFVHFHNFTLEFDPEQGELIE